MAPPDRFDQPKTSRQHALQALPKPVRHAGVRAREPLAEKTAAHGETEFIALQGCGYRQDEAGLRLERQFQADLRDRVLRQAGVQPGKFRTDFIDASVSAHSGKEEPGIGGGRAIHFNRQLALGAGVTIEQTLMG